MSPTANRFATPLNEADAQARTAFRAVVRRYGTDAIAARLAISPRTVQRIGTERDVPPGIARNLLDLLAPRALSGRDDDADQWAAALLRWAQDCDARKDASLG